MKIVIAILLSIVPFVTSDYTSGREANSNHHQSADTQYIFEMTEGYFQVRHSQPIHLLHTPLPKIYLNLGDTFRTWAALTLKKNITSPCSRRTEEKCIFAEEIVEKSANTRNNVWTLWKDEFQTDGGTNHYAISTPGSVTRKMALGSAAIRYRILKENKLLFSYEIPIEVR